MQFYTHVFPWGNKMLVRGYENDRPFSRKIDFFPTLYVTSNKESKWRTLDGQVVDEIKPGTIKETREFVDRYKEVAGFQVYGNTNYVHQYISDTYESDIRFDMEKI
jgi:hypothetical protein